MIETRERDKVRAPDRLQEAPELTTVGPEVVDAPRVRLDGAAAGLPVNLMHLQRAAGNAAVAELVSKLRPEKNGTGGAKGDGEDSRIESAGPEGVEGAVGGSIGSAVAGVAASGSDGTAGGPDAGVGAEVVGATLAETTGADLPGIGAVVGEAMGDEAGIPAMDGTVGETATAGMPRIGATPGTEATAGISGMPSLESAGIGGVVGEPGTEVTEQEAGTSKEIGATVDAAAAGAAAGAGGSAGGAGATVGDSDTPPALTEVGQLASDDETTDAPSTETGPEAGAGPAQEAAPAGSGGDAVEQEAGRISGADQAAAAPVSGLLDTLLDTARSALRSLAGRASSGVRSLAAAIRSTVGGLIDGARSLVSTVLSTATNLARDLAESVTVGARLAIAAIKRNARSVVIAAVRKLPGLLNGIASTIRSIVLATLTGGVSLVPGLVAAMARTMNAALDFLPARIRRMSERLVALVETVTERVSALVTRVHDWIASGVDRMSDMLLRAVTFVSERVSSILGQVASWASSVPAIVRPAVRWIIDRILSLAGTVIAGIQRAVTSWISGARGLILRGLEDFRNVIRRQMVGISRYIVKRIRAVSKRVLRVLSAIARLRDWIRNAIRRQVQRAIAAISRRVNEAVVWLVVRLIGPQLRSAVEQLQLAFPNGMPAPQEIAGEARNAANRITSKDERGILDGLLRPEGDHIGISIGASGSFGKALGVSGSVGCSLDVVFDYRRNEAGFFVTPQLGVQGNIGEVGGSGFLNVGRSWGTVGSFGDPNQDVLQSWGGWSTGLTYGVQASLAKGFGGGIASGGQIYRGGSKNLTAPGSGYTYTPIGAGTRTEPGQPIPTQEVPGTPSTQDAFHMGEVRFPTGLGDVGGAQPPAGGVLDTAAAAARAYPSSHPGAEVTGITVTGEASPPWKHPRPGMTPEQETMGLSQRRAQSVAGALQSRLPETPVGHVGIGSRGATGAGIDRNDPAPERQRALITGEAFRAGTAPTTTGGGTTPPTQVPNTFEVTPSIPDPFTSEKTAWGWDTTVTVSGGGGAKAQAGVYGGVTTGYAFPIGKAQFNPTTMKLIRIAVGLYKLWNDLITGSPMGFMRDAVALGVWGIEELLGESVTTAVLDWVIPMPAGA